jgi:hypothetical protein
LLELCALSDKHREYLESEGIDPAGCGSLAYARTFKIAGQLAREFGEAVAGRHPALMQIRTKDGSRTWWTIPAAADGILFPAKSVDGLITGLQIRKDKPAGKDDRYRQVSHGGLGGTPLSVFKAKPGDASPEHLLVTEGFKKASAGAAYYQCAAISLAGVSAYNPDELIRTVEALAVKSVSLAFDMDKRTNPNVARAEQRLLNILAAAFPELTFFKLEWWNSGGEGEGEGECEKVKGLDDAIKAGAELAFKPAVNSGPRLATGLPAAAHARAFPGAGKMHTLEQARALHQELFARLMSCPDGSQTAITSPTGTGKSTAVDNELARMASSGMLQGRWLILAPNKANIDERTAPDTELGKAVRAGYVAIQQGRRLIDLGDMNLLQSPFDCANPKANEAGAARQIAAKVVCSTCPFGSDDNWQAAYPDGSSRPWKCEQDGYLASRKASAKAVAVLATREAFLNNSDQIGDFDGVVADEELVPFLIESISIGSGTLAGWRQKIGLKGIVAPSWERLFQVIEKAGLALAGQSGQPGTAGKGTISGAGRLVEAGPSMEAAAASLGYYYDRILQDCDSYRSSNYYRFNGYEDIYDFEEPYSQHNTGPGSGRKVKDIFPFRGARELLDRLLDDRNPARFARSGDGSYSLELHIPRTGLIDKLDEKTLVVMDATLPPQLKILFPKIKEVRYDVPQNIFITQATNGLFSKRDLYKPETRAQIEAANESFAAGSNNHLTILPLRFQEGPDALHLPAGSQVEHWGLHRATSKYSSADSLTLMGHHERPIDCIAAEVIAARSYAGKNSRTRPAGGAPAEKLRLYNHLTPNSQAVGRWMRSDQDPDIQAAIESEYAANIIQAIGRARAALRSFDRPPVRVLILCNEPVAGLPIDLLTTTRELATNPPQKQIFTNNSYMKRLDLGGLVPAYTDVMNGIDAWDDDLIQDETAETQEWELGEWPQLHPPLIE